MSAVNLKTILKKKFWNYSKKYLNGVLTQIQTPGVVKCPKCKPHIRKEGLKVQCETSPVCKSTVSTDWNQLFCFHGPRPKNTTDEGLLNTQVMFHQHYKGYQETKKYF